MATGTVQIQLIPEATLPLAAPVFRVSSSTQVHGLAGGIAGALREHGRVELQAIGAAPVNQAIKAAAIARNFLAAERLDLTVQPAFTMVRMPDGALVNAIHLLVELVRR